jgi:transposase
LLPDCVPATAQVWLSDQIEVVARDRGGGAALAGARALPRATQVADRWHLIENATRAFLYAVRKSMRQIRSAIAAATINPPLLTAAERIEYEGYLHRDETNAAILGLAKRQSSLELHLQRLDEQWMAGHRNGAELWRRLKRQGFRGCARVVSERASRRRRAEKADGALSRTAPSRTIARLMTISRNALSNAESVTVAAIESGAPLLVASRELIGSFQAMVRKKLLADLEPWLEQARSSLVASFANGVKNDAGCPFVSTLTFAC